MIIKFDNINSIFYFVRYWEWSCDIFFNEGNVIVIFENGSVMGVLEKVYFKSMI